MRLDLGWVRQRMPGRFIEWSRSTASTMTDAARLARAGCASGTVIGADEQTAGIGRHGHSWHSEAGLGLYTSMVLRLPVGAADLPIVMLALGLATQEAIAEAASLAPDLRWPNDVLLDGKKCAGIMAVLEGDAVIAGIGINVNHTFFPPDIESTATSLRIAGGKTVSREELLTALIDAVDGCCKILVEEGSGAVLRMFVRASSYAQGRRVCVEQDGKMIEGTTCGLTSSGFLLVRQDDGKELTILAGGVRPA